VRLLLIRHAEVPTNVDRLLETTVPGPSLTEEGRRQAAALVETLAHERITAVFRSPLVRTGQTIQPFLQHSGLIARVLPGLAEIEAGDLESRNDDIARDTYHSALFDWVDGRVETRVPGGPDGIEFLGRFDDAIAEATSQATGAGDPTVAVVSHGAALRAWTGTRCANLDRRFVASRPIPNTGVLKLTRESPDAAWRCVRWLGAALQSERDAARQGNCTI
jgi:broad specificity phosphatase PhoE